MAMTSQQVYDEILLIHRKIYPNVPPPASATVPAGPSLQDWTDELTRLQAIAFPNRVVRGVGQW